MENLLCLVTVCKKKTGPELFQASYNARICQLCTSTHRKEGRKTEVAASCCKIFNAHLCTINFQWDTEF